MDDVTGSAHGASPAAAGSADGWGKMRAATMDDAIDALRGANEIVKEKEAEIQRLRLALTLYANPYAYPPIGDKSILPRAFSWIEEDQGFTARAALAVRHAAASEPPCGEAVNIKNRSPGETG